MPKSIARKLLFLGSLLVFLPLLTGATGYRLAASGATTSCSLGNISGSLTLNWNCGQVQYGTEGTWALGADPQPSCDGTGGSAWPNFGDDLYAVTQCPVFFTAVGIGGTSISQWDPNVGGSYYYTNLKPALLLYPVNGLLSAYWFQGETDAFNGTSQSTYQTILRRIISQSRTDCGWNIPWGIGIESYYPGVLQANVDAIAAAQTAVAGDQYNFAGPSMNSYTSTTYRTRTPDFGPLGMSTQASLWVQALQTANLI